MGCDIHLYVEKRVDGSWVTADKWFPDEDYPDRKSIYDWGPGFTRKSGPIYDSRNYDLFAILADVRNGRGFAGVDTGDGFVPIHPPRGVPEDCCPEVRAANEYWDSDGHSSSWATVQELMEYDWTQETKKRGLVGRKQFVKFKLSGRPKIWAGDVHGGNTQKVSNDEMKEIIAPGEELTWEHYRSLSDEVFDTHYTLVEWGIPYYDSASEFLSVTMPKLWRIGRPEDVRIVYWFDN